MKIGFKIKTKDWGYYEYNEILGVKALYLIHQSAIPGIYEHKYPALF